MSRRGSPRPAPDAGQPPGSAATARRDLRRGWRERLRGNRWRLVVLLLLVAYFVWLDQRVKVRPDHAFLIFLIVVLLLRQAKAFLRDWSPFIGAWIVYDMMRGVADDLRSRVLVEGLYRLEVKLFGWLTGGEAPPIYSLTFQQRFADSFLKRFLDNLSSTVYAMHMGAVILVAWVLWHTVRDRRLFYRFAVCFTVLNILGFATFLAVPTAPPWYVNEYGFAQPPAEFKGHGAGSLINFDRQIGYPLFENLYGRMNPNRFAAFPSLHAAYAVLVFLFLWRRYRWRASPAILYPLGVSVGAVYLVHHYIIDVLAGYAYVVAAMLIGERLVYPLLLGKWEARQTARGECTDRIA
ncbi:MAG: phosphatase PAP2 family protein [Candidatus Eisenbacteria bacterium]|nr:phosphatase PAP2 family protein [Candidatus Eisenbacteria bacterium]